MMSPSEKDSLLMDYALGRCTGDEARQAEQLLAGDESAQKTLADLKNTFAAMDLLPDHRPAGDLVAATMDRIAQHRRTQALLAQQETRRPSYVPTFSLRELVAAAVVILIAGAILVPSIRQSRQLSLAGLCASHVGRIGEGLLSYSNMNNGFLPGGTGSRWLPIDGDGNVSTSQSLFRLVHDGYASPLLFQCPTQDGGSFVVRGEMTDFPDPKYISYSYQHSQGMRGLCCLDPAMQVVAKNMAILADCNPIFAGGRFWPQRLGAATSLNHGDGQNVLYLDMHVDWVDNPNVGVAHDNIFLIQGVQNYRGDEAPTIPTDTFLLPPLVSHGN